MYMYSANINGLPVESPALPGYTGYDCSEYLCPYGNNMNQYRYNSQTMNTTYYAFHGINGGMYMYKCVFIYL